MGALKRTVTMEPSDAPVSKRLKRVERQVKAQRPEMKTYQITHSTGATAASVRTVPIADVPQGDGVYQRVGQKIKIWRVDIRGVADPLQDIHLIQAHTGATPAYAEYRGSNGAFLYYNVMNSKFTEWGHVNPVPHQTTSVPFRITRKFRGMEVTFDDSSSTALRNSLFLTFLNHTGSTLNHNCNVTVWFTDS